MELTYSQDAQCSSYFLLSFCFRKVVWGGFSESAENLRDYFYMETKNAPEGGLQGGPQARDATWPWFGLDRAWAPPGRLVHRLKSPLPL